MQQITVILKAYHYYRIHSLSFSIVMLWVEVQPHHYILLMWGLDEWQSHWYFD